MKMDVPKLGPLPRALDQIKISQQSAEQTILLNAIKNKFANSNENHSGTSPPVFNIPTLKMTQLSSGNSLENDKTPSKLNQFILGQLSESPSGVGAFAIPNLQIPNKPTNTTITLASKLDIQNTTTEGNILSLNTGIRDLCVCDESENHVIDLTTALNKGLTLPSPRNKQLTSIIPNPIDFQIPFIDCDLRETALRLPLRDEYCEADVYSFVDNRFICSPSRFGKITCLRYRLPKRTFRVDHSFKTKHNINRFGFETKSPDDVILASLRKYNRA